MGEPVPREPLNFPPTIFRFSRCIGGEFRSYLRTAFPSSRACQSYGLAMPGNYSFCVVPARRASSSCMRVVISAPFRLANCRRRPWRYSRY